MHWKSGVLGDQLDQGETEQDISFYLKGKNSYLCT